jgi:hypothetical protein
VRDTVLDSAEVPLDMELGFQADRLDMTVFGGAVRNGRMVVRGGNVNPNSRTYSANSANLRNGMNGMQVPNPTFYVYPYFMYGNGMYGNGNWNGNGNGQRNGNRGRGNSGAIVPPVVNNPTNPGYQPTQIVPPMSDPIRVPVTKP